MAKTRIANGLGVSAALCLVGCTTLKTEHEVAIKPVEVEVKPIHITIDVNLRIERELDSFFGDLDAADPTLSDEPKGEQ